MQIHIISVGKLNTEYDTLARLYAKMIRWQLKSSEITYNKKLPPETIKQHEAQLIDKYLDKAAYKIALDVEGKALSSEKFSDVFSQQMMQGKNITFIIGGAFGLDQTILDNVDLKLSLSNMTMPHQLAKVILLEQIYRAQTIINNHPYHK